MTHLVWSQWWFTYSKGVNWAIFNRWIIGSKSYSKSLSGWWLTYPSEKYAKVSWDYLTFPAEWKVIKFHGSKPPSSYYKHQHLKQVHRLNTYVFLAPETFAPGSAPRHVAGFPGSCRPASRKSLQNWVNEGGWDQIGFRVIAYLSYIHTYIHIYIYIHIHTYIWVNYIFSLTWTKAIWG